MPSQPRTVVCFGDSNTFGSIPTVLRGMGHRLGPDRRWPGILKRKLGVTWSVIEEGHPSRTTVHDDPVEGHHLNGLRALPIVMETHMPIDIVVLSLGVNDLKYRFSLTALDVSDSVEVLVREIKQSPWGPSGAPPQLLVVAPPPMQLVGRFAETFRGGDEKSKVLGGHMAEMAERQDVLFLDAGTIVETSAVDGLHLDSGAHRELGVAIAAMIADHFHERR
ncbi:MAG: SGNH/GDSL hydrolase family protein [Pseudomonadota bacterium]